MAGGVTMAVSVGAAGDASGFESVDLESAESVAGAGCDAGASLAGGVTAAVDAGAPTFVFGGTADAAGSTSFGGSVGFGMAAVVAGADGTTTGASDSDFFDGGKYVVVPPGVS